MSKELNDVCERLRLLLQEAVKENLTEGLLLSGGLDTSILAVIASKMGSLKAFTVGYEDSLAPDMEFAKLVADRLKLKHAIHAFNYKELSDAVSKVINIMKSFDPMEVPQCGKHVLQRLSQATARNNFSRIIGSPSSFSYSKS